MATMRPLRRRMIEDMTIRNLSPETQQSYVRAVAKFSNNFGRSPDRLGLEEVRAYQVHLTSQGIAWSSLNQTVCALRFWRPLGLALLPLSVGLVFAVVYGQFHYAVDAVAGLGVAAVVVTSLNAGLERARLPATSRAEIESPTLRL